MSTSKLCAIIITVILTMLMITPANETTQVGVTFSPSTLLPPPQRVVALLQQQNISAVRITDPSPEVIQAFYDTNISLFISIPNAVVPRFTENDTDFAKKWIFSHVVAFYTHVTVTAISVGDYVQEPEPPIETLTLAIQNTHKVLSESGIYDINISTSLSYTHFVDTPTTYPSDARFLPTKLPLLKPLLRLITQINASFYVTVHPYVLYRKLKHPSQFALFEKSEYVVRDAKTRHDYLNLFDFMVDSLYRALEVKGFPDVPIIVTETGWPCLDPSCTQAGAFANGLIRHVKTVDGTPSRKDGVPYVFIYTMFDDVNRNPYPTWHDYGICYPNMSMKFKLVFVDDYGTKEGPLIAPWKIIVVICAIYWIIICSAFCIKITERRLDKEVRDEKELVRKLQVMAGLA